MSISYWSSTLSLPEIPSLKGHLHDEIVVIGGGIAGLTTAYLLLKEGKSVTIITDKELCSGETSRTTGHLTCMLDERFFDLEKMFNQDVVSQLINSHTDAISQIERICQEELIACDFQRVEGHLFQESELKTDVLQKEFELLERLGVPSVKLEHSPFSFFHSEKMLTFAHQAQFHPLKYAQGLLRAITKLNGKIFSNAHVVDISGGTQCQARTENNFRISANTFVIATNTPINNRFIMHTKQAAYRTYACAATIPKNSVPKGLYYDTLDPYHYVRLVEEDKNDILIIGGEDHKTGQDDHCEQNYEKLERWAKERFPMIKNISHFWSGQVLEPIDSIGFLGKNPFEENVYIITGHSGNGLTYSTLGGIIIRDLIVKKTSPYEELYKPSRITFSAADEFLKENINVGKQYIHCLPLPCREDVNDLPNNCGKVIQKSHHKIAVYRDQDGACHEFSAVCPHLGCIVNWNDAEKTWDCPCHGSRFHCKGKVICGPATSDLKQF